LSCPHLFSSPVQVSFAARDNLPPRKTPPLGSPYFLINLFGRLAPFLPKEVLKFTSSLRDPDSFLFFPQVSISPLLSDVAFSSLPAERESHKVPVFPFSFPSLWLRRSPPPSVIDRLIASLFPPIPENEKDAFLFFLNLLLSFLLGFG